MHGYRQGVCVAGWDRNECGKYGQVEFCEVLNHFFLFFDMYVYYMFFNDLLCSEYTFNVARGDHVLAIKATANSEEAGVLATVGIYDGKLTTVLLNGK